MRTEFKIGGKLPEVTIDAKHKQAVVDGRGWHLSRANLEVARGQALMFIALTQKLEEYFGSEEYAARRLAERRDAIANSFEFDPRLGYGQLSPWGQKAVDRIIELEDLTDQQLAGTGQ